ncbi:MAG: hypothetical protein NT061_05305 [Spirochaetes bacterium]|nr:hypothetical protein [Spirochaetota bacterium]
MRTEAEGKRRDLLMDTASGLVSGLLYLSFLLSFAFLIPVQRSFASRGTKSGLIAAGSSLVCITAGQSFRLSSFGAFNFSLFLASSVPPLLFLAALSFVNMRLGRLGLGMKILLASILLSIVAAPFVVKATADQAFIDNMKFYISSVAESSGIDKGSLNGVDEAIRSAITTLRSAFAPLLFWVLGFSWLTGSRLGARSSAKTPEEREARIARLKLGNFKVPQAALWPTLASWALLLVVLAAKLGAIAQMLAWNLALCSASLYTVQGLGIIGYLSDRYPLARLARLLLPIVAILIVLNPMAGAVTLTILPLLGITEVWYPYRNLKGALK